MAIIATLTLVDSLNTQVTKRYECEATTLAQAAIDMNLLLTDLGSITDLGIVSVTYSEKDTTEASAAGAGSNVDVGATFRLRLADGGVASHKVPGFPIAKVGGNRAIDPTDADVVAYFDNFLAAGAFTLSDGEVITEVLSGTFDV
jgi:hypothetical protein